MNERANQWMSVAGWFRTQEQQLRRASGMRASMAAPPLPHLRDPEAKNFLLQHKQQELDQATCRQLDITATYQAVLSDPGAEDEILENAGYLKDEHRLEQLYTYAKEYAQEVEGEAKSEQTYRKASSGGGKWLQAVGLACLLVIVGGSTWIYTSYRGMQKYLEHPAGTTDGKATVVIPKGSGADKVATLLQKNGVIIDEDRFFRLARYYHYWKRIFPQLPGRGQMRAGTYIFPRDLTPVQLLARLRKGPKKRSIRVTIPEGFNIYKIAARLERKGICRAQGFLYLARNGKYASRIVGWDTPSLEGYLYPDTYKFHKNSPPDKVARRMVKRFKQLFTNAFKTRMRELNEASNHIVWTVHKVVTLASIVEKETGQKRERPMISSVFHNRLRRRWKLETDPTVIYGLLPNFDGNIRSRDLHNPHKYNTYKHKGLPPGPIASPGVAAMRAALWPTKSRNMFFVSKNDGSHIFSKTGAEHRKWVNIYQKKRKAPKKR